MFRFISIVLLLFYLINALPPRIENFSFDIDLSSLSCSLRNKISGTHIPLTSVPYNISKVQFMLWTRNNPGDTQLEYLYIESLASNFDGTKKTYFFFHGFTDNGTRDFIMQGKSKILNIEEANVISVNYSDLVIGPETNYPQAMCNSYKIANHTAYFIRWLIEVKGLDANNIHLIGHSLGAHLAGMVGKFLTQNFPPLKVERITGLDPAGPIYEKLAPSKRLDKSSAAFVDVIHTNGCPLIFVRCKGIETQSGHIDFYPNGGEIQPGCQEFNDASCSHQKAAFYFTESIVRLSTDVKMFKAWKCSSWEEYKNGSCSKSCAQTTCLDMGFNLKNQGLDGAKFYLSTGANPPYAKGDQQ